MNITIQPETFKSDDGQEVKYKAIIFSGTVLGKEVIVKRSISEDKGSLIEMLLASDENLTVTSARGRTHESPNVERRQSSNGEKESESLENWLDD